MKLLLLQQWYGLSDPALSDPALEEAVDDRLWFRRFVGVPLDHGVPDHTTIWRFRQQLARHGLAERLFTASPNGCSRRSTANSTPVG